MKYALPMTGFHLAPNFGSALEFTIYDKSKNTIELVHPPKHITGVLLPRYLMDLGVQTVVVQSLDASVLQELIRLHIIIISNQDGEVETLVDRIRWNALDEGFDNTLQPDQGNKVSSGSCCGGGCSGTTIEDVMDSMAGHLKNPLPFDQSVLPKKPQN